MDRQTRRSIKSDKFAEEVGHTWEFLSEHSAQTKRYAAIVVAVLLLGTAGYFYYTHQKAARADALAQALQQDPVLNATPANQKMSPDEKEKAREKLYEPLAARYHGTLEGSVAGLILGSIQADKGNLAGAEKIFQDVVDSAPSDYASVARISLSQVLQSEGKTDQAKTQIQYDIDHPTALVSKEEATVDMARLLEQSNPQEAKKLLDPLVKSTNNAVSRAAVSEMSKIAQ